MCVVITFVATSGLHGGRRADQDQLIADAFADDDIIADFERENEARVEAQKPIDIDLLLPGWGEWAGPGKLEVSKYRKKRCVRIVCVCDFLACIKVNNQSANNGTT